MKSAAWRLVAVNLFWGLSFPLLKMWQEGTGDCPGGEWLATFTLLAARYTFAAVMMTGLWRGGWRVADPRAWRIAVVIGLVYFVGATLQVVALLWTTPAVSAFITSLGGAWVPLLGFCFWRNPIRWQTWVGLAFAVAGVFLLSQQGSNKPQWALGPGELLTLLASLLFAVQILLLDRYGRQAPSQLVTLTLFATSGLPSLLIASGLAASGAGISAWLNWSIDVARQPSLVLAVCLLTVFSTILAFSWMNKYQPLVPANRAALLYFLEPLFATAFSWLLGYDRYSATLLIGGALIIGGNVLAEPSLWGSKWEK
jgi:drug/metabolite transporter (DMT)-like permease